MAKYTAKQKRNLRELITNLDKVNGLCTESSSLMSKWREKERRKILAKNIGVHYVIIDEIIRHSILDIWDDSVWDQISKYIRSLENKPDLEDCKIKVSESVAHQMLQNGSISLIEYIKLTSPSSFGQAFKSQEETDRQVIRNIMNEVDEEMMDDALFGQALKNLADEGYKVTIEKDTKGSKLEMNLEELKKDPTAFKWCHPNEPDRRKEVTGMNRCIFCKYFIEHHHGLYNGNVVVDGYCNNEKNSRKILVIDSKLDFCKYFITK